MKKLIGVFVLVSALIFTSTFEAKSVGITIKVGLGVARFGDCYPGKGICFIIIISRDLDSSTGTARAVGEKDVEYIDGTAELKGGKLYITASKPISEGARNERGALEVSIKDRSAKSPVTIDPSVAKALGVDALAVLPGDYTFNGNSVVFNVVSPRDAASGQASGKRSNIAIDEPGVQKETKPKGTLNEIKPTYDLKENKK